MIVLPELIAITKDYLPQVVAEQTGLKSTVFGVLMILFVLFDVEVIFMYPWAVNFKELGTTGILEMFVFMALLLTGFYYIIRKGALKWE